VCRIYFRRFRIAVWLVCLLLLGSIVYLNQIGLPGFVKNPLLEKLRAQGIDLQFSRLRWRFYQGIVAENVTFGKANDMEGPKATAAEVAVQLNRQALRHFQLQVDTLRVRHGQITLPVADTNQPGRELAIQNIQTDLLLLPGDQWQLEGLTAGVRGALIKLSGAVSNASAVREWKFRPSERPSPAGVWQARLRYLADALDQINFSSTPDLRLDLRGDARDVLGFHLKILLNTPDAQTPWGSVKQGKVFVRIFPRTGKALTRADVSLEAADAQTPWGTTTNLQINVEFTSLESETNLVHGDLSIKAAAAWTKWANCERPEFSARWTHSFTNPVPLEGEAKFSCQHGHTKWADIAELSVVAGLAGERSGEADETWGWWRPFARYPLDLRAIAAGVETAKLNASRVAWTGQWRGPLLSVTNIEADLPEGALTAFGSLDVATRGVRASLTSSVDPHKIEPVLTEFARNWLGQFTWRAAPELKSEIALTLPAGVWTNAPVAWKTDVQPSLYLNGEFNIDKGGTFRGLPADAARSHFIYSNMVWRLPDLTAIRPEGQIQIVHTSDDRSKDFYWGIKSTIDPMIVRPLLETNAQRGLDLFAFKQPPAIDAEVWGRWHREDLTGIRARVGLTNFAFRGETADGFQTYLQFTNRFLLLTSAQLQRGSQRCSADGVGVDINAGKVYLTNGLSTTDPMVIARAIGPHVARAIEPYQFLTPPLAHVRGTIPTAREQDADLYFDLDGGPFRWWNFRVPHIAGTVHWTGTHLDLNNVAADFYGGMAGGAAGFDFSVPKAADYHFYASVTNASLRRLLDDLSPRTNRLEGVLNADLVITRGNLARANDFDGYGDVHLHDGLIWSIPIFGVFSPALDSIAPGLGSSRASAGDGSFLISNGVLRTDDTEIRSPAMRLRYRGTVNLEGEVGARVEAELLRDVWLVGPLVSTIFWPFSKMFEYKVSGSLSQPHAELLYLGKMVEPFRAPKPTSTASPATNTPAISIPPASASPQTSR
jgi:hypothetical protein